MKIHGPYTRKDGRKHICIVHDNGRKQTKSYPRYLMEQYLGRELLKSETVDHINNDYTDDRIENLQILTRAENVIKDYHAKKKYRKTFTFICPECGKIATKYLSNVKGNLKKKKLGPYCSRKCAGIVGKRIQMSKE